MIRYTEIVVINTVRAWETAILKHDNMWTYLVDAKTHSKRVLEGVGNHHTQRKHIVKQYSETVRSIFCMNELRSKNTLFFEL